MATKAVSSILLLLCAKQPWDESFRLPTSLNSMPLPSPHLLLTPIANAKVTDKCILCVCVCGGGGGSRNPQRVSNGQTALHSSFCFTFSAV